MRKNTMQALVVAAAALLIGGSVSVAADFDAKQSSSSAGAIQTHGTDGSRDRMDVEPWDGGSGRSTIDVQRKPFNTDKPRSRKEGSGGAGVCEPSLVSRVLEELFEIELPCD